MVDIPGKIPFDVNAVIEHDFHTCKWDALVIVADSVESLSGNLSAIKAELKTVQDVDSAFNSKVSLVPFEGKRLIFSPTGPLNRDQDDVRRFSDAAEAGVKRAVAAGAKELCLLAATGQKTELFQNYQLVTLLAALSALYVPLEVREQKNGKSPKVSSLLFLVVDKVDEYRVVRRALAIENGRIVARDIGGGDPERMAAENASNYIKATFCRSDVKYEEYSGEEILKKKYPLLAAVNRCAQHVPRHAGRVIKLHYKGKGITKNILYFVGKGITYDTGGADIKTGGNMAGMHRDKCGAANVAGFFRYLDLVKPDEIEVVGYLGLVRNSVGSECYVADEVITSRAGVRVRVTNTDAEGRMIMADLLCEAKELVIAHDQKALQQKRDGLSPHLFTIATLTGHAVRTYGDNYTAVLDNGPARDSNFARDLQKAGDLIGDPLEVSTIRKEDYDIVASRSEYEDLLQTSPAGSPRGHQYPAAFLIIASGLDKHGIDSSTPIPYTHLDIAGSGGSHPKIPTAAPIPALIQHYKLIPSLLRV